MTLRCRSVLLISFALLVLAIGGWWASDRLHVVAAVPTRTPGGSRTIPDSLRARIEPTLLKKLLATDAPVRGIVVMRERPQLAQVQPGGLSPLARRTALVRHLRSLAARSQQPVLAMLAARHVRHRSLWIVNSIAVEGTRELFLKLAARSDVAFIREDRLQRLPVEDRAGPALLSIVPQSGDVQWNVRRINADRAWTSLGITGEGSVVAIMDSGVDWQHPALRTRYRGYTGKSLANHEGNWYCATDEGYAYPGDGLGHGTHVAGIIVGEDGLGVAPGARWIAVKVFNNQGVAYNSWIHDGFQWLLAPAGDPSLAPDVVNNSWGNSVGTSQEFLPDVQALRAAGIVPVFAAGNDGPEEGTVGSPASLRDSLAVGATDDQDVIARFSSRGPSPWGEIKPEVSAPGVSVLSSLPGGGLGTKSGTSMAAPHVTGLVALILQANPELTVDEVESVIVNTARPLGDEHPNNDYGWGLVDAYAAVTQAGGFGQLSGRVTDAVTGQPVAGAGVRATAHGGVAWAATEADADGRYGMGLVSGVYDVRVGAFGYLTATAYGLTVLTGTVTTFDAPLTPLPTGVLRGTVREAGSGLPLPAAIYLPSAPPTTTASADGSYELTLPVGEHVVRVEHIGHRFLTATVVISAGVSSYRDWELEPAPTILLVDSGAWYNHSYRVYYEQALESLRYLYDLSVIANVDITPTDVPTTSDLLPYDLVIWSAPYDAPGYIGASAAISGYLSAGGRLLLSGQDVAFWDGGGAGLYYAPYFERYLKARYVADDAPSRLLDGEGTLFAGLTITIAGGDGADNQLYPDVIAVDDEDYARSAWQYQGDGSGGQVVGPCLPYRVVYLSFGVEGISRGVLRREVLQRSIEWLIGPPVAAGIELRALGDVRIARPGEVVTHELRLRNTGETNADSYAVSLAGGGWPRALLESSPIAIGACQSATLHLSVAIPDDAGWHTFDTITVTASSSLSPALFATALVRTKTPAPVLLVDGARFYHFEDRYRDALERCGIPYDYHRVKGTWPPGVPPTDTLRMYPVVAWYTAYDWYQPLSAAEEARLIAYLEGGGRLLLSSQDYLYYGYGHPLASDYLGVLRYVEDAGVEVVEGEPLDPIGWGLGPYTLTFTYSNWSDVLLPAASANIAFRDADGLAVGLTNASKGDTAWRTAFTSFSLETLGPEALAAVMGRAVGWLSWLGMSTWGAGVRAPASGEVVTMTAVLRNDGLADLNSVYLSATLPAEVELVGGPVAGAVYHPLTRTVTWRGGIGVGQAVTVSFQVRVTSSLAAATYVPFPARIGSDDHLMSFLRPYYLRVDAPDLSLSSLAITPTISSPGQVLSCVLTMRNVGARVATATVTATIPPPSFFTGTLDSGGVGSGQVVSRVISWRGPVAPEGEVVVRYHLSLNEEGDYWLVHDALIEDQYGERWRLEGRSEVRFFKLYLPLALNGASPAGGRVGGDVLR